MTAHRRITNLILNHICDCWQIDLPCRILLNKQIEEFKKEIRFRTYEDAFSDDEEQSVKKIAASNNGLLPNPVGPFPYLISNTLAPIPLLSLAFNHTAQFSFQNGQQLNDFNKQDNNRKRSRGSKD